MPDTETASFVPPQFRGRLAQLSQHDIQEIAWSFAMSLVGGQPIAALHLIAKEQHKLRAELAGVRDA